jgi:hypothetical protein
MAMTPLGEAASSQLRATFAANAGKLRGFAPSKAAKKNTVVVRGANGKIGRASLPALPRGARGPAGPAGQNGTNGAPGATGAIGPTGAQGPAGRSALTPLQSGETISGDWGAGFEAAGAGDGYRAVANFPIPLVAGLDAAHRIYVPVAPVANCPGPGQAAPGFLCVYQGFIQNANTPTNGNIFNPEVPGGPGGTGRFGFSIFLTSAAAGVTTVSGVYSVTGA